MRKLYKSDKDKIFAGVIGGIGDYVDIDPTVLRLVFILLAIMTAIFPSILAYLIAMVIIPNYPKVTAKEAEYTETKKETPNQTS